MTIENEIAKLREEFNVMRKEIVSIKINLARLEKKLDETAEKLTLVIFSEFCRFSRFAGIPFEVFVKHFLEEYLRRTGILTIHYIVSRYPDAANSIPARIYSRNNAEDLLKRVKKVIEWVKQYLQ
jgi:hypothetical protein